MSDDRRMSGHVLVCGLTGLAVRVAEQLHLPLGTVKRRLHEARTALLAVLEAPGA